MAPVTTITVQTRDVWHTRLLLHSTEESSLLSESGSQEKEVVLPWEACSSSWWAGPCSGQFVGPFLPVPYPAAQV